MYLGQFCSCDWVEMADSLQVFFNVLAIVGYPGRRYDGFLQDFEADLAAQKVRHVPFLSSLVDLRENAAHLSDMAVCIKFNLFHL